MSSRKATIYKVDDSSYSTSNAKLTKFRSCKLSICLYFFELLCIITEESLLGSFIDANFINFIYGLAYNISSSSIFKNPSFSLDDPAVIVFS